MTIDNSAFEPWEIKMLEFVLQFDFEYKSLVIKQLNELKEIVRDHSPYYKIMDFPHPDINNVRGMWAVAEVHVLRNGGVPTCFILFMKNDKVYSLEVFNADSGEMNMETIYDGDELYFYSEKQSQ